MPLTISKTQNRSKRDIQIFSVILALVLVVLWLFGNRNNVAPQEFTATQSEIITSKQTPNPQNENQLREAQITYYFNELRFAKNAVEAEMIEAKLYAQMSVANSPTVNLLLEGAAELEQSEDWPKALQIYQSAQNLEPSFSESFARAGAIAYRLGDKEIAKSMTLKALSLEPRHFAAWHGLGTLYEEAGDLADARKAFENALYHNPNLSDAERAIFRIDSKTKGIGL